MSSFQSIPLKDLSWSEILLPTSGQDEGSIIKQDEGRKKATKSDQNNKKGRDQKVRQKRAPRTLTRTIVQQDNLLI